MWRCAQAATNRRGTSSASNTSNGSNGNSETSSNIDNDNDNTDDYPFHRPISRSLADGCHEDAAAADMLVPSGRCCHQWVVSALPAPPTTSPGKKPSSKDHVSKERIRYREAVDVRVHQDYPCYATGRVREQQSESASGRFSLSYSMAPSTWAQAGGTRGRLHRPQVRPVA